MGYNPWGHKELDMTEATWHRGAQPHLEGFQGGSVVKNPPANAGDLRDAGSIPGSGRFPGVGNRNLLQYSCLENPCSPWGHKEFDITKHAHNPFWNQTVVFQGLRDT